MEQVHTWPQVSGRLFNRLRAAYPDAGTRTSTGVESIAAGELRDEDMGLGDGSIQPVL